MSLLLIPALLVLAIFAFYYYINYGPHDDDDEVYWACFNADASPVATPHAFYKILERLPKGSKVLDVGVGSGTYLEFEPLRKLLLERDLHVDGVDISDPNIKISQQRIMKHGLEAHFTAKTQDARTLDAEGAYDAILYMESFPCMSVDIFVDILKSTQRLLKPKTGITYLYHNLADPSLVGPVAISLGRMLKPCIKFFLGIDFGRLTTKPEMRDILNRAMPEHTEESKTLQIEVLLAADCSDVNISFKEVANKWNAFFGKYIMNMMVKRGPRMEQHLITLHQRQ